MQPPTAHTTSPAVDEEPLFDVGDLVEVRLPYLGSEWALAEITQAVEIRTACGQRVYAYDVIYEDDTLDDLPTLYGAGDLRAPEDDGGDEDDAGEEAAEAAEGAGDGE